MYHQGCFRIFGRARFFYRTHAFFLARSRGSRLLAGTLGEGGFPNVLAMPEEDLVAAWFDGFIRTFIERDLRELGYNLTPSLCSRLLQHGAESDLVLVSHTGELYCIEIKFSSAPVLSKGFYQCIADLQPAHKYVIVPVGDSYPKEGGVRVINLHDFLSLIR